jgi:hypothetical protein
LVLKREELFHRECFFPVPSVGLKPPFGFSPKVVSQGGKGNREQGTGNREQGTGNREQGTGNREQGRKRALRRKREERKVEKVIIKYKYIKKFLLL